ncbi:MAG: CopG family transcriptional regulator [Deltaproteobacteria bacterium]|nr:CopG family transcriptional regulator [Deltaproteobacteria bacterium]
MDQSFQMAIPPRLHQQIRFLVEEGWYRDENELLLEALRRFLDSHRPEIMDKFIRNDVEWGLHGQE